MSPPAIVKIDTHPTNTNSLYLQFTFSSAALPSFSFCEFFQDDQGCLTFERLDLLVSFCLPNKSGLQLPGASLWLRSDLFKIYQIYLSFDLGRRFIHKLPGLVIYLIGCKLLVYHDKPCKAGCKLSFVQIHTFVGLYILAWHVSAQDLGVQLHLVAYRYRQLIADSLWIAFITRFSYLICCHFLYRQSIVDMLHKSDSEIQPIHS